jgi:aryl-alcohol dehydrogenase-like predicted oxidoreductase
MAVAPARLPKCEKKAASISDGHLVCLFADLRDAFRDNLQNEPGSRAAPSAPRKIGRLRPGLEETEGSMEKRRFGRAGNEVSVVGFGGAPIGILETEQQQVARILNTLLDEGVNVIDTAASYQGSEQAIGQAVAHRRDEYVLISKCGAPGNPDSDEWKPEALRATVDRALTRLRTDHLDVMLLHTCGLELLRRGEALETLDRARQAGKVRHIGYSGDNEAATYATALPDVAVVETSLNICDQANIDGVLLEARAGDVAIIAKRPIANAAWKDVSEQPGFYQGYAQDYARRLACMDISPADLGFEGDERDAWPELALRFTLSLHGVHTAIIGTTNPDHARANLAAAAHGPLEEAAFQKIRDAFRAAEASSGQKWKGLT